MNICDRQVQASNLLAHEPPSFAALARMQQIFDLTLAETRLLGLLASGYTLEESSQIMACSVSSARTYSKRIYDKTDAHTQARVVYITLKLDQMVRVR